MYAVVVKDWKGSSRGLSREPIIAPLVTHRLPTQKARRRWTGNPYPRRGMWRVDGI